MIRAHKRCHLVVTTTVILRVDMFPSPQPLSLQARVASIRSNMSDSADNVQKLLDHASGISSSTVMGIRTGEERTLRRWVAGKVPSRDSRTLDRVARADSRRSRSEMRDDFTEVITCRIELAGILC